MQWRIDRDKLLIRKVLGDFEGIFSYSSDNGEWGIKNDGCLLGRMDVLVGIGDGDGTCVAGESTTHSEDRKRDGYNEGKGLN